MELFLKNGGSLFSRYTDPEEAVIWFDDTKVVFDHMGCPPCLWVRVASTEPVDFDREINPVRLSGRPFLKADIMGGVSRVLQTVLLSKSRLGDEASLWSEYHARFLTPERFVKHEWSQARARNES